MSTEITLDYKVTCDNCEVVLHKGEKQPYKSDISRGDFETPETHWLAVSLISKDRQIKNNYGVQLCNDCYAKFRMALLAGLPSLPWADDSDWNLDIKLSPKVPS